MWINLTKLPETELTPWFRELLRRGWVWLALPETDPFVRRLRKEEEV